MNAAPRILVATDGSESAQHAVTWAASFARDVGGEVILAHTMSKVGEWLMSVAQIDFVRVEAERRRLLDGAWSEPLRAAGVEFRTTFLVGDPVDTLIRTADEADVDFIVIGKTGHSAVGGFFVGGSATRLSQRTTRPLLLVPAPPPQ